MLNIRVEIYFCAYFSALRSGIISFCDWNDEQGLKWGCSGSIRRIWSVFASISYNTSPYEDFSLWRLLTYFEVQKELFLKNGFFRDLKTGDSYCHETYFSRFHEPCYKGSTLHSPTVSLCTSFLLFEKLCWVAVLSSFIISIHPQVSSL